MNCFSRMSKKSKQTYFNDAWLTSSEFTLWISKSTVNTQARCKLCKSNFGVSNTEVKALRSQGIIQKKYGRVGVLRNKKQMCQRHVKWQLGSRESFKPPSGGQGAKDLEMS